MKPIKYNMANDMILTIALILSIIAVGVIMKTTGLDTIKDVRVWISFTLNFIFTKVFYNVGLRLFKHRRNKKGIRG